MDDTLGIIYEDIMTYEDIVTTYLNEGLSPNGRYRLNGLVHKKGPVQAANQLIDLFVKRDSGGVGISASSASVDFDKDVESISELLINKDFDKAIKLAKKTAEEYATNEPGLGSFKDIEEDMV